MQQIVKNGGGLVMMWGCISCDGVGPMVKVERRLNSAGYIKLLEAKKLINSMLQRVEAGKSHYQS